MLIAIDGPAGAGKSSVARALAAQLGFTYLDTGAMYRCVALLDIEHEDDRTPAELAAGAQIAFSADRVLLDGEDVSERIRRPDVTARASEVAADPGVREALVGAQRRLIASGDWVAEGRDIGTVVAPGAELKVFLTADPAERARRRAQQTGAAQATVAAEQAERDARDTRRAHGALRAADDALPLDSTGLTLAQVVARIAELARARR